MQGDSQFKAYQEQQAKAAQQRSIREQGEVLAAALKAQRETQMVQLQSPIATVAMSRRSKAPPPDRAPRQ